MVEWIDGLAWGWGLLLGYGAGTVLVVVFGIVPILIYDEVKSRKQERAMIVMMDYKVRADCKQMGLSKKDAAKIIANRNEMMKLPRR